jgi:golgi-specific brefeldin A-resistance guanine nucleotide exchange factor 1
MITTMNVNRRNSPLTSAEGFDSSVFPANALVPNLSDDADVQECCHSESPPSKPCVAATSKPPDDGAEHVWTDDSETSFAASVVSSTRTPDGARHLPSAVDALPGNASPVRTSEDGIPSAHPALSRVLRSMVDSMLLAIRSEPQSHMASHRFVDEVDPFPDETTGASGNSAHQNIYMDLRRWCRSQTDLDAQIADVVTILCHGIAAPEISAGLTGTLLSALLTLLETPPFASAIHAQDMYDTIIDAALHCVCEETSLLPLALSSTAATSSTSTEAVPKPAAAIPSTVPPTGAAATVARRRSSVTIAPPLSLTNLSSANGPPAPYEDSVSRTAAASGSPRFNYARDDETVTFQLLQLISRVVHNIASAATPTVLLSSTQLAALLDLCGPGKFRSPAASALLQYGAAHCERQLIRGAWTAPLIVRDPAHFCGSHLALLSSLLLSKSRKNSDDSNVHSLSILKTIVEMIYMGGTEIKTEPAISQVLEQQVSRAIITLAIHTDNYVTLKTCIHTVNLLLNLLGLSRLKCEFEVFIHAALLRRLHSMDFKASSLEEKEVVLEYLLEICRSSGLGMTTDAFSPVNMLDLYLNYDCDCDCSNVFEFIMSSLGKCARPTSSIEFDETNSGSSVSTCDIDRRSIVSTFLMNKGMSANPVTPSVSLAATTKTSSPDIAVTGPSINHLNRLALHCILATMKSIEELCRLPNIPPAFELSDILNGQVHAIDEDQVQIKRKRKLSLDKVVRTFNTTNPDKGQWLDVAVAEGIFASSTDYRTAAEFLFQTHMDIDKQRIGVYLSRGPESGFPFHAGVRSHFASMHNFRDLSFAKALRKFLSKFRLPGEAQCIDRLMEAFSKEYFEQNSGSTFFQNSDAVYVLAFSTIMLNTDLHNPTIKADQRMTVDQFLRNNRGINSGEDLLEDFLSDLYDQIKERELQIRTDVGQFLARNCDESAIHWNEIQERKLEIDAVICLSMESRNAEGNFIAKDMFHLSKNPAYFATVGIFLKSTDDRMVFSALRGLQRMSTLATSCQCTEFTSDILHVYLSLGQEYISKCISQDTSPSVGGKGTKVLNENSRHRQNNSMDSATLSDDSAHGTDADVIPLDLLSTGAQEGNSFDVNGSASHRGLLALDSGLALLRADPVHANETWPVFVQCLCGLRDAQLLPPSLSDLDDFADCNGNILPLSSFARASKKRLDEYHRSLSEKENSKQKGWFRSLFRKSKAGDQLENTNGDSDETTPKPELSAYAKALKGVVEAADIDSIVHAASVQLQDAAIGTLLQVLDAYPFDNDPAGEQNAVFTLEIAARALLSKRERAESLFLVFLGKFESILCKTTNVEGDVPASPFVIERIVVTILRCSIHLYEFPELRPHLRASLQLLTMTLPKDFVRSISDRISCGLAIILRANYPYFEPHHNQEWSLISEMFDILANYATSRVLVFDGIASTVEHAMPNFDPLTATSSNLHDSVTEFDAAAPSSRPGLSLESCSALARILTRFVLGFYQGDQSLSVPAMLCLEKVYRRKVELLLLASRGSDDANDATSQAPIDFIATVPDKELWQNVVVAMYSVCRSTDPDTSTEATQCYRRLVLRTGIEAIAVDQWITILYLMVNKQPPVVSEVSRANTFSLLGQLFWRLLPQIRAAAEYRDDLEEFMVQFAAIAEENIAAAIEIRNRSGSGRRSVLLDKTIQTLTYISNHIMSEDEWEDGAFRIWMNETLMHPIEIAAQSDLRFKTGKVVTTRDASDEDDDVSEISDSVAGDDGREEMSQSEAAY